MFDVAIVGGGPAGLAAAVYLARQKIPFILFAGTLGGQALWSSDVENYLGFHLLDGVALVKKFREHLEDYRDVATMKEGEEVRRVERGKGRFHLITDRQDYEAKTILVATGTRHRTLNVPGEKLLYGKGVTYCATCDAPLFRDKVVYVIGGGNSAMDAALFAEKYASSVTLVTINPMLAGDGVMMSKIKASKKITLLTSTKTSQIFGKERVVGIGLIGPDKKERMEKADGVFIEIGLQPVAELIDFVAKDKWGQIVVDKDTQTSVEGIWAAGDVTDITEKQIAIAVGEGSKAAISIIRYLQTHH